MTIQEAIKSGKPFRRKRAKTNDSFHKFWHSMKSVRRGDVYHCPKDWRVFNILDILATDWEVKP
jgi:ABC-type Fe3+-hydroxamate transport system substrate-binding protein